METLNLVRVVEQAWGPAHIPHTAHEYEFNGRYVTIGVWSDGGVFIYPYRIEHANEGQDVDGGGGLLAAQLQILKMFGVSHD